MPDTPPVVAIVDDDQAMREALFELLQVAGLSARTYEGANALLADYQPGAVDVVVTDVRMPGVDGLELQERLHRLDPSMPVVFVTGSSDPATRRRAVAAGAYAYLSKPIGDVELMGTLWAALAGDPPVAA